MVKMWTKTLEAIEEGAIVSHLERFLSPPEQYLFALDVIARVRLSPDGRLRILPRRPEWAELLRPLLSEAEPYKEEIYRLVKEREKKVCFRCFHWTPLDDSFGICDLMPGICGRLYGCNKFQSKEEKSCRQKESMS